MPEDADERDPFRQHGQYHDAAGRGDAIIETELAIQEPHGVAQHVTDVMILGKDADPEIVDGRALSLAFSSHSRLRVPDLVRIKKDGRGTTRRIVEPMRFGSLQSAVTAQTMLIVIHDWRDPS